MMQLRPRTRLLALVFCVGLCFTVTHSAEDTFASPGEPTSLGNWEGSWTHHSRDFNLALWIRADEEGLPEIRFQYMGLGKAEGFRTDWGGLAEYRVRNGTGEFAAVAKSRGSDRMEGTWAWSLNFANSSRVELAVFSIYRVGDGRSLYIDFTEFERILVRGGAEKRHVSPHKLGFRKASRRLVLWDELPF